MGKNDMGGTASMASAGRLPLRGQTRLLRELHGHATPTIFLLIGAAIVSGVAEAAALMLFIRGVLSLASDEVEETEVMGVVLGSSPGPVLGMAALLVIVAMAGHVVLARSSSRFGLTIQSNSQKRLMSGFLRADWPHQSASPEGVLQEAASNLAPRVAHAASSLVVGVSSLLIAVTLLMVGLISAPLVTLGVAFALVPVLLVLRPLIRATRLRSYSNVSNYRGLAEEIAVTTTLVREYRTFGVAEDRADEIDERIDVTVDGIFKNHVANRLAAFLFKDLALLAFIGVIGVLYLVVDLTSSSTSGAVLLIVRSLGYAQVAYNSAAHVFEGDADVARLVDEIDEVEAQFETRGTEQIGELVRIELSDVSYTYDGGGVPALDSVSLAIDAGESVGVGGRSGSGKSTFAELMLGLRVPSRGQLLVNGIDLAEVSAANWSDVVAYVPQDPRLAATTVQENIRFYRSGISDDDVVEAARAAHISEVIDALPDGYDTVIGPRSQGLSGGQRQRLAIARALAGRPQMLVLDEPTSALDAESEELFVQTLAELRGVVTLFVIAHRPHTLDVCHRRVELVAGRVAVDRTPEPAAEPDSGSPVAS